MRIHFLSAFVFLSEFDERYGSGKLKYYIDNCLSAFTSG